MGVKQDFDAQRCPTFRFAQHPAAPPAQGLSVIHSTVEACKQGAPLRNKIHVFLTKKKKQQKEANIVGCCSLGATFTFSSWKKKTNINVK